MLPKKELRHHLLSRIQALSLEQIKQLSQEVVQRFLKYSGILDLKADSLCVGMYAAMPQEVDLSLLRLELGKKFPQWRFCFPRVHDPKLKQMEFVEMALDSQWSQGFYGVVEPLPGLSSVSPSEIDLVFVPGIGFGESGERIGRGAGYYDRYLMQVSEALRVALTFDFQLISRVEQTSTDQPVHWIWTEKRQLKTPYVNQWFQKKR